MSIATILDLVRASLPFTNGPGVVVAVSGGGDSVAMLRLLDGLRDECGLRLSVAHMDHGARGESGRAYAGFVENLAGSLGLPFDLGHWTPTREGHFEADARDARYAWLVEVAKSRGAEVVAVAHTEDDQAETVLHRILRGTGLRGLSGMPRKRDLGDGVTLVRPLLDVSRASLREYLATVGQEFREDETNADLSRTRNRIRLDLMPKLADEYNPRVGEALTRLGRIAEGIESILDERSRAATESASEVELVFDCDVLKSLPISARAEAIRVAWRASGWPERAMNAGRWIGLARAVEDSESRHTTAYGIDVRTANGRLHLSRVGPGLDDPPPPTGLWLPDEGSWGGASWGGIAIRADRGFEQPGDEMVNFDAIEPIASDIPGLSVRAPEDGDRFDPLGMEGKTQSLNDFFRGRGVSKADRPSVPLVVDARGIVWVVGHRIAHRVRVTEGTTTRLFLRAEDS